MNKFKHLLVVEDAKMCGFFHPDFLMKIVTRADIILALPQLAILVIGLFDVHENTTVDSDYIA